MITRTIPEDIFETKLNHIAFAVNKEGFNDCGFAGEVACRYWPELMECGEHEIGEVISKKIGNKTYHALVCHSLKEGWGDNQREVIKQCFNNIPVDNDVPISSIAIGTGLIGRLSGADFGQIICGMFDSDKNIAIHMGGTVEQMKEFYESQNQNRKSK